MKFTNSYELILHLFSISLIEGIELFEQGEFRINTTCKNSDLLDSLNEIWKEWRWGKENGVPNAIHCGTYNLELNSNQELVFKVSICDDILSFEGNPFDMEKILAIIAKEMDLNSIGKDEPLEFQLDVHIDLNVKNVSNSEFEFHKFDVQSFETNEHLENEINRKENKLDKVKNRLVEYFIETHKDKHCYDSFNIEIENNFIRTYDGTGTETIKIKKYLKSIPANFKMDLSK